MSLLRAVDGDLDAIHTLLAANIDVDARTVIICRCDHSPASILNRSPADVPGKRSIWSREMKVDDPGVV